AVVRRAHDGHDATLELVELCPRGAEEGGDPSEPRQGIALIRHTVSACPAAYRRRPHRRKPAEYHRHRMHTVTRITVPARSGASIALRAGQVLRVIDLEGTQVADLVAISQADRHEYLDTSRTCSTLNRI